MVQQAAERTVALAVDTEPVVAHTVEELVAAVGTVELVVGIALVFVVYWSDI